MSSKAINTSSPGPHGPTPWLRKARRHEAGKRKAPEAPLWEGLGPHVFFFLGWLISTKWTPVYDS